MDFGSPRGSGPALSLIAALLYVDAGFLAWVRLGALGADVGEDPAVAQGGTPAVRGPRVAQVSA